MDVKLLIIKMHFHIIMIIAIDLEFHKNIKQNLMILENEKKGNFGK